MTAETITELQKEAHEIALAHGWWDCQECKGEGGSSCNYPLACDHKCSACNGTGRAELDVDVRINNMLEEVGEMWGEIRAGRRVDEIWWRHQASGFPAATPLSKWEKLPNGLFGGSDGPFKPEGFPIELADLAIWAMDACEEAGVTPDAGDLEGIWYSSRTSTQWIRMLANEVNNADGYLARGPRFGFYRVIAATIECAKQLGIDLEACVRLKSAFNRTRPRMHGKVC